VRGAVVVAAVAVVAVALVAVAVLVATPTGGAVAAGRGRSDVATGVRRAPERVAGVLVLDLDLGLGFAGAVARTRGVVEGEVTSGAERSIIVDSFGNRVAPLGVGGTTTPATVRTAATRTRAASPRGTRELAHEHPDTGRYGRTTERT
jgi:hypothetical protein